MTNRNKLCCRGQNGNITVFEPRKCEVRRPKRNENRVALNLCVCRPAHTPAAVCPFATRPLTRGTAEFCNRFSLLLLSCSSRASAAVARTNCNRWTQLIVHSFDNLLLPFPCTLSTKSCFKAHAHSLPHSSLRHPRTRLSDEAPSVCCYVCFSCGDARPECSSGAELEMELPNKRPSLVIPRAWS